MPIGAAVVLVVTGLLADARTPYALEGDIGRWVFDLPDLLTPPLRAVMQVGGQLAIVLVAAALVVAGRYRAAGAAALAGLAGWLASSLLKDAPVRPSTTRRGRRHTPPSPSPWPPSSCSPWPGVGSGGAW